MDEFKIESDKFYKKLFSFINLNHALVLSGYASRYIADMNEQEYGEYMVLLEYLDSRGIIDISKLK